MTCTTRSALSMTAAFHKRQNDIAPLLTETAIRMCWRAFELAKTVSSISTICPAPPRGLGCRAARFQIMEIVGDRKRGKEWAEREQLYQAAETVSDVREPYACSTAVPFDEAAKMVAEALAGKARHYGQVNCAALDALVYIDLRISHLWPPEARNAADTAAELDRQGWRSVSMLSVPYGAVLTANASAPDFLRANIGLVLNAWPGLDDWFDP
jgi:hypothetical protein